MPTVTIACKLPSGLLLRVFKMEESQEPVMGGGFRSVKVARQVGETVRINGCAHPQDKAPLQPIVQGTGYALTPGVDKEFWDTWLAQNKDLMAVRNGLIFAHEKEASTVAEAREKKSVRSGLERLDPDKLPSGLEKVKTADAVAA